MSFSHYENTQKHTHVHARAHTHTHAQEENSLAYMIEAMIEVGNGGRVLKTPVQRWHWTG